ncbi:MAG: GGDEF domain-containing protein [Desulfomonilaceae bacterium]|nr:GGDEF domain-containing protein [Desulfomonilaceae bacterium]
MRTEAEAREGMRRADTVKRKISQALERLDNLPKRLVVLIGILLLILVEFLDYSSSYELSFSVFYLIPIALVSRYVGMKAGALMAVMGAITWLIADLMSGHPYSHPLIPFWNASATLALFLIVSILLAHAGSLIESLRESTHTDLLTGIVNSRGFRDRAQAEMERSDRYNRPFSMAYVDLDNFKTINDTLGHSAGDELLIKAASVLKDNLRNTDVVARLGGDEFAILLPETRQKLAQRVIGRCRTELVKALNQAGGTVTASIGTMTFLSAPKSVDEMIRETDRLMYQAKKRGKNSSVFETYQDPDSTEFLGPHEA